MSESLRLDAIQFAAGTQAREAINESVVADYAELLSAGTQFPPVVLFHDGSQYFLADGFHRGMAHARLKRDTISAEIIIGTKEDALWFALGANKANAHRMTEGDKRHAIKLALSTWPDKTATHIAEQIGCSRSWVSESRASVQSSAAGTLYFTRKNGRRYPAVHGQSHREETDAAVRVLVAKGITTRAITRELRISPNTVAATRKSMGFTMPDRSPVAVTKRRDRMKEMAAQGYTSIQIADELDVSVEGCRQTLRDAGISVQADKATAKSLRPNSTRIIAQIVVDAENLAAGMSLIEFNDLDAERIDEWVDSLKRTRQSLQALIQRLAKRKEHSHVQIA